MQLIIKVAKIKTVFRYRNIYPLVINSVANGDVNIDNIVADTFDFNRTNEAFNFVFNNPQDIVKKKL